MDKSAPKRSLRAFILIGFILAISAVALMGYQAYNSVNNLARDLQAAADEDPYLTSLNRILNELTTAESDVRAYTITRDTETDLPESQTVINGIVQSLDELEAEFSDRRSFLEFQRLVEEKVEIMQELTTMVDTNQSSEVYDRFSIEVDRVVMESTPKPTSPTSQLRRLDEAPESITSQPEKPKEPEKELSPSEQRKLKRQKNREKGNLGKRILSRLSKEPDPIPELKVPEKQEVITQNPKQDTEAPQQRPNKPAKVAYRPEKVVEELQSSLTEIETEDYIARELIQGQIAELTEDGQEVMGEIKMMVRKLETKDSEKDLGLAINAEEQANETTRFIALFSSAVVLLCLILIAVIFGDMARNYRLQKRLQQEKSRAEILAKVKEDFLANMSHEIRTPMNAVIGFSEQLSQTSLSKKQNKLLQPVRNSAHYLLALINDILDYSKLESGNFKLEQSSFRPQSLLAEVLQTLQPLADKKQITLSGEGWEPIPLALQGDPLRLRQMLFNLIGNAIKFTEEGSVRLKAEIVSQKSNKVRIRFSVIDTGIGIPEEQLEKVFQNFVQAESSTTRRFGGTGLGLSITKKLAKLHGGDVSIESVLGEGTTVSLWLPYLIGDEKDIPAEPNKIRLKPQHLKGKRILVADDEAYNRELIELILDKWEVQSDIVHDGKAAFEKLQSETYDIALMDLRMPEMDGKSVARRAREELQLDLPILALTATSTEEEVSQALQAGMNGHLLKPFQEADLLATITHLLGLPMEVEEIAPSENAEPEPKIRQDQFSLHALEKLTNHNPATLQRMLALFLDASKENMVAIQVAIQHEDWEEISMRAHRLIPPCRHLGLEAMVEQFKAIEQQANQKRDWPELVEALTEGLDKLQAVNLQVEKHLKTEMGSSK